MSSQFSTEFMRGELWIQFSVDSALCHYVNVGLLWLVCVTCKMWLWQHWDTPDVFFFPLLALQPPLWVCILQPSRGALASSRTRFLDHTQRRATVRRTPLDEWSIRHRDLYLTTHNTHNRQISMPRVGFEPTISAGERPKSYALDRAATETGN